MKSISSQHNESVKQLRLLMEKSRERKSSGLMVIEGWKEILMAHESGYVIKSLFIRGGADGISQLPEGIPEIAELSPAIFDKLTYRGAASQAIAIAVAKHLGLDDLQISRNPLIIITDAVEKPGNIGAIIRTADAVGADAVICSGVTTDIYNPNIIRSSVGCVFTIPIAIAEKEAIYAWLKKHHIQILTTSLKASIPYTEADFRHAVAIVLGTEATGVDTFWEDVSDANIILPMLGKNDSLNVSNTAAVILYEAIRQRHLSTSFH
jgi:TrmH family RNA methyltransferase